MPARPASPIFPAPPSYEPDRDLESVPLTAPVGYDDECDLADEQLPTYGEAVARPSSRIEASNQTPSSNGSPGQQLEQMTLERPNSSPTRPNVSKTLGLEKPMTMNCLIWTMAIISIIGFGVAIGGII